MAADAFYDIGDVARLTVAFTNTANGSAVDPDVVTASVRKPSGEVTDYTGGQITRTGAGLYELAVTVEEAGDWAYKFHGEGTATDTGQGYFFVNPDWTAGSHDLCTVADVRRYVPAYVPNPATDATLEQLITAASQLIPELSGREIIATEATQPAVRTFTVDWMAHRRRIVNIGDLASTDDLVVELYNDDGTLDETVDAPVYVPVYDGGGLFAKTQWEPITGLAFPSGLDATPDLCVGKKVQVTGTWGFPAIPTFVREATAARVILRYMSEVDASGTGFAAAIRDSGLNLDGLFQSSQQALMTLGGRR